MPKIDEPLVFVGGFWAEFEFDNAGAPDPNSGPDTDPDGDCGGVFFLVLLLLLLLDRSPVVLRKKLSMIG